MVDQFHNRKKEKKAAKFLGEGSIREITARPLAFSISSRSSLHAWFHWTGQPDSNYDSLLLRDRRKKRRTKKKDRCVHFWNVEKTLLEIYVKFKCEIQITVKLHLYEILISDYLNFKLSFLEIRNYGTNNEITCRWSSIYTYLFIFPF